MDLDGSLSTDGSIRSANASPRKPRAKPWIVLVIAGRFRSHWSYCQIARLIILIIKILQQIKFNMGKVVYSLLALNTGIFWLWKAGTKQDKAIIKKNTRLYEDHSTKIRNIMLFSFSHKEIEHFAANMTPLLLFGRGLERVMGSMHMIQLTKISIITGYAMFYINSGRKTTYTHGADALAASVAL